MGALDLPDGVCAPVTVDPTHLMFALMVTIILLFYDISF